MSGCDWLCGGIKTWEELITDLLERCQGGDRIKHLSEQSHSRRWVREWLCQELGFGIRFLNLRSGLGEGATRVRGSDTAQSASADLYLHNGVRLTSNKATVKKRMGNARPRPKLLPEKLLLIRDHLNATQTAMQELLNLLNTSRVSEYENGVRMPNLMITLAYSRLGKVSMASVVDDDVSIHEFREQLGKFELAINKQDDQAKQRNRQRNKQ